jgi:hypothetical protein
MINLYQSDTSAKKLLCWLKLKQNKQISLGGNLGLNKEGSIRGATILKRKETQ